jgi:hypothetical protein
MMPLVTDKLKRLTTISATTVITILSFTLVLTFVIFVMLSQTSFAQPADNGNQTTLHLVVRTVNGPSDPFPANAFRGTSAFCENDEIVTGGGFHVAGPQSQAIITSSGPVKEEHGTRLGWGTHGHNPTDIDGTIQAIVHCAKLVR